MEGLSIGMPESLHVGSAYFHRVECGLVWTRAKQPFLLADVKFESQIPHRSTVPPQQGCRVTSFYLIHLCIACCMQGGSRLRVWMHGRCSIYAMAV